MKKLLILTAVAMLTASSVGCRCGAWRFWQRCSACDTCDTCDTCSTCGSDAPMITGDPIIVPGSSTIVTPGPTDNGQ